MRLQSSDSVVSTLRPGSGVPASAPPSRNGVRSSNNSEQASAPAPAPSAAPQPVADPAALTSNPAPGSVKAALSFVQRITLGRKPAPIAAPQPSTGADSDGPLASAPEGTAAGYQPPTPPAPPLVTETEVIEPAAPGSLLGHAGHDDALDLAVAPPCLERTTVAEYVTAANNWLMTDRMLEQHEEFVARGLLMIRNVVRSEPRYAAQESVNWLPVVRDSLASKHGLVRAAAASALAAFAASTPGREAIQKDPHVLPRLMQMLTTGLVAGGDNNDTQYSCLALANMALNTSCKQPLMRHGALPRAADVLRAAIRFLNSVHHAANALQQPYGGSAGGALQRNGLRAAAAAGGGGGPGCAGRRPQVGTSSSVLKSASYMTTMLMSWAVEPLGREQLQQYDVSRLATELHERCCSVMGEDFQLSRRLALLADASSAAELLEEIAEAAAAPVALAAGLEAGSVLDDPDHANGPAPYPHPNPHATSLRGVSFVDTAPRYTGTGSATAAGTRSRASVAMHSLQRLVESETGGGSPSSTCSGAIGVPTVSSVHRTISKKHMAMAAAAAATNAAVATAIAHSTSMSSPNSLATANSLTLSNSLASPTAYTPSSSPPAGATTTTITATTTTTTMSQHPPLFAPRDTTGGVGGGSAGGGVGVGGGGVASRSSSKLLGSRCSQPGVSTSCSSPLGGLASTIQFMSPFAHRSATFSDTGFHPIAGGVGGGAHASQPQPLLQQQLSQAQVPSASVPLSAGGASMLGVHFSASIFMEAAAAAHASRGAVTEEEGSPRSSSRPSFLAVQHSSRSLRLPTVRSGRAGESGPPGGAASAGSRSGTPLSPRGSEAQPHALPGGGGAGAGRLELPFHLVRPTPTISATNSKVSRISAAYGPVSSSKKGGGGGGGAVHPLHTYPRGYTSEL